MNSSIIKKKKGEFFNFSSKSKRNALFKRTIFPVLVNFQDKNSQGIFWTRHFSNIKLILVQVYKLLIYHFAFSFTN